MCVKAQTEYIKYSEIVYIYAFSIHQPRHQDVTTKRLMVRADQVLFLEVEKQRA